MDKTLIIVPAYNEKETIDGVLEDLQRCGYKNVVVVDDGSTDKCGSIAAKKGAIVLRHVINRGLGAAIGTGFEYAKLTNPDIIVTFDSDGQHKASDLARLIYLITSKEADVVIGSRMANFSKMPKDRKIINHLANLLTNFLYGIKTTDSQSGLRAFNREAYRKISIRTDRMEVSSEILKEIKVNKLKFREVPIEAIYSKYSRKKGQEGLGNLNAFNVGFKMLLRLFR